MHKVTPGDVAADFRRCVDLALVDSDSYLHFMKKALSGYEAVKHELSEGRVAVISKCLKRIDKDQRHKGRKLEDILLVSNQLLLSHY